MVENIMQGTGFEPAEALSQWVSSGAKAFFHVACAFALLSVRKTKPPKPIPYCLSLAGARSHLTTPAPLQI